MLETAEPGGTPIGLQIRRVLLDAKNQELCPTAELLLMFATRAQNVDQAILPALAAGQMVLSDRFTDSTLVYQGAARGLGRGSGLRTRSHRLPRAGAGPHAGDRHRRGDRIGARASPQ